jgi:transposase
VAWRQRLPGGGPTGFGLHRALTAAGVDSVIVAPGLVPSRPGDRVKTDKRDARRLAGLHAAGLLTEIFVPTLEHEALRDLVRAREDARLVSMDAWGWSWCVASFAG